MSRKKIVAGNWKMNKTLKEGKALVEGIMAEDINLRPDQEVIIAPPFIALEQTANLIKDKEGFYLAAQNCHQESSGAFTGEVSAQMLKSVGVDYVILGHSERREYFGETDALLAKKVDTVLKEGMKVIFCCGEPLQIREADTQNQYIQSQIEKGIFHLTANAMKNIVIAYEPIWAIGTGLTASDAQAQEMHAFIRSLFLAKYGAAIAENLSILYGGSAKPSNAAGLFAQNDVDGGLIGGSSLNAQDFVALINAR
ncbi:MAG TPA: triose-phosphate isomerase [Edaphocola sp.]|nr:triose-phosphate isomerase [Edaphocola sp.]